MINLIAEGPQADDNPGSTIPGIGETSHLGEPKNQGDSGNPGVPQEQGGSIYPYVVDDDEPFDETLPEEDDPPLWVDSDGRTIEDDDYPDEPEEEEPGDIYGYCDPRNLWGEDTGLTRAERNAVLRKLEKERIDMQRFEMETRNMTPEEIRAHYLRQCPAVELPTDARSKIYREVVEKSRDVDRQFDHYLTPSIMRSDANGFYVGSYENWRLQYYDTWDKTDKATDSEILDYLLKAQPHRVPCALTFDGSQPVPTYGPLMLPESSDPIAAAPAQPEPEARPAQWSPDATHEEITVGVARELLDCAALYAARIKVATGHRTDAESIDQLYKLSQVLKNAQRIADNTTKKSRRYSPGAPRKRSLPQSLKVTTLKLEIAEKNKIYSPHKKRSVTPIDSDSKVELNSISQTSP